MNDPELALSVACRLSCVALGIGFLEQLTVFDRAFGPSGPFSAAVAGVLGGRGTRRTLFGKSLRHVLIIGAVASVVGLIVGPYPPLGRSSLLAVLVCMALVKLRRVTASDGAEQMAILTLFAAGVAVLPGPDQNMTEFAVWFVSGQSILSYMTAGIAKALSPTWRRGEALPLIMGSETYGQPWVSRLLETYPKAARHLTKSVILFECCFPFIIVAPPPVALVMFGLGVMLHLTCAVSMGLNAFLFAFPGSYFCVAYVAHEVSPFW